MLNETIALLAFSTLLQAAAASLAGWGYLAAGQRRWVWLCLIGACTFSGLRSAIPFWVAINVGLYDYRDALLTLFTAIFCLAAIIGLVWPRR